MYYLAGLFAVLIAIALFIPEASEARTYTGTWASADGTFVAKIKNDRISMNIHVDDVDGLYWKGSFKSTGSRITSKADRKVLANAIFGSEDSTKLFVYRTGRLHFPFSIQGVAKVISLRRTA
jgi:hypothetical protein